MSEKTKTTPAKKPAAPKAEGHVKAPAKPVRAAKKKPAAAPKADEQTPELTPPISSFAPVPDAKLSGPPYQFDKNNHCTNPKQRVASIKESKPPVAVYLTFCEREGSFSSSYRLDVPAFGANKEAKSYGPFYPFAGTGTLGYKTEEIAMYEAGRMALEAMTASPDKFPKGAAAQLAIGVERLRPAALKRLEAETSIVGYDPANAPKYLAAQSAMIVHPNGVEFADDATEDAMRDIGFALEHFDQKSNWIKGDWYNAMKKRFPKILDTLIQSDTARRTYINLGSICAAFPLETRTFSLSFTHYAEAIVDGVTPAKRLKYLEWADKGGGDGKGVSTLKLRAKINEDLGKPKKAAPQTPVSASETTAVTDTTKTTTTPASGDSGTVAGGPAADTPIAAGGSQYDETPVESEPAKINRLAEKAVEDLDALESFFRAGYHKSPHLSASKSRDLKNIVAKLYELANK